jgi:hypothetical protein
MPEETDPQETAMVERLVQKLQAQAIYVLDQANPDPDALRAFDVVVVSPLPSRRESLRRMVGELEILMAGAVSLSVSAPEEFARESQVQGMRSYRAVKHGRKLWPLA